MKENDKTDITDKKPTITFQNAKYRALGLNFVITNPAAKMPAAEDTKANVPVNKLEADDDCLNNVSMSFGEKIQNGMKLKPRHHFT